MNRLIIVGNGFDLAHGMDISFKDFITDYYNNAIAVFHLKGGLSIFKLLFYEMD